MIETIHIFDEYSQSPGDLSPEQRHKKRMNLEVLIFDILKKRYGGIFHDFWKRYNVPTDSNKSVVIVERRIHPNLAFLLYNAAYFCRGWNITIICSDINYEYCRTICENNLKNITIYPYFKGNPSPDIAKKEYNDLMCDVDFYHSFQTEFLLFMETDSYLRRPIPEEVLHYDYVAAPYVWDRTMAGGGLSFRKRSSMIKICDTLKQKLSDQDIYISKGIQHLRLSMPNYEKSIYLITESVFAKESFGVHQWWTFFFPKDIPKAEEIFHEMMTLHV